MNTENNIKVGIILPSRGLTFTAVEKAIEEERQRFPYSVKIYRTANHPIPDCNTLLVEEAMNDGVTHFWFIEEDTVPPAGCLDKLIQAGADIAYVDYGIAGWSCSVKTSEGKTMWCGFGCTMVKRHVFKELEHPWFRSDKKLRLNTMEWVDVTKKDIYGGHDIWFFYHAFQAGCSFKQIEGECRHLQLDGLGTRETNSGLHMISDRPKINKFQIFNTQGGEWLCREQNPLILEK